MENSGTDARTTASYAVCAGTLLQYCTDPHHHSTAVLLLGYQSFRHRPEEGAHVAALTFLELTYEEF